MVTMDSIRPLRSLTSWNVFLMLGISPQVLSRPTAIGQFVCDHIDALQLRDGDDTEALRIVALQEVWAFSAGVLWLPLWIVAQIERACVRIGCTSRCAVRSVLLPPTNHVREVLRANSALSIVLQLLAVLLHFFVRAVSCGGGGGMMMWDPKKIIAAVARSRGLPHAVGFAGSASSSTATRRSAWMDSGLMLLASAEPTATGFEAFDAVGGEGLANKGALWALWDSEDGSAAQRPAVLIINAHLIAEQDARGKMCHAQQRAQLAALVRRLQNAHGKSAETYLCGDLNMDLKTDAFDTFAKQCTLTRVAMSGTTNFERTEQIDHILSSQRSGLVAVAPRYSELSDHALIAIVHAVKKER